MERKSTSTLTGLVTVTDHGTSSDSDSWEPALKRRRAAPTESSGSTSSTIFSASPFQAGFQSGQKNVKTSKSFFSKYIESSKQPNCV